MPELPEVETYRRYFEATSLGQKVTGFECADERLLKKPVRQFREALIGQEFTGTERIGKYLFIKTSGDRVLVMHFGMTGNLEYYHQSTDRPKYAHIVYSFVNGYELGFLNRRKFGWNDLIGDIEQYRKQTGLSRDARDLTLEEFKASLSSRKTFIKPVLMDQRVAAGMGNWLVDEVLYQSRIHPERKVPDLSEKEVEQLYSVMQEAIRVAIEKEAVYREFPDTFFIHIRKDGTYCHHTGVAIEKKKVGGRTTYFSPEWQKI